MVRILLQICCVITILGSFNQSAAAYSEATHQYLAWLSAQLSKNLQRIVTQMGLAPVKYDLADVLAAQQVTSFLITGTGPAPVLIAGAVLEDKGKKPLNHFLDGVSGSGLNTSFPGISGLPSNVWGYNGNGNEYSWVSALNYSEAAFIGKEDATRKFNQQRMFRAVGHVTHLAEDVYQPSHTRNDPHSPYPVGDGDSELENWAAHYVNPAGVDSEVALGMAILGYAPLKFNSFIKYFTPAASFSNGKFFSDDTIANNFSGSTPPYAHPSVTDTTLVTQDVNGHSETFLVSMALGNPTTSSINTRLARQSKSLLSQLGLTDPTYTLSAPAGIVCKDNLKYLLSGAVANGAGLIDYFFRGSISAGLDSETSSKIVITNTASFAEQSVTLSGGSFKIRYETVSGLLLPVPGMGSVSLSGSLSPGSKVTLPKNVSSIITDLQNEAKYPSPDVRANEQGSIVVYYRGTIGSEDGFAVTTTKVQGFRIVSIDGPSTVIANQDPGIFATTWEGAPKFPVTLSLKAVECPPGLECISADIAYDVEKNPLTFPIYAYGCTVATFYVVWQATLIDDNGVASDPYEFPVSTVFDGSCFYSQGSGPLTMGGPS